MIRRPTRATRTNTLLPSTTLFRYFHRGRHLFGFHLIKDITDSKVCAQLYVPASDRAFFHVHAKRRQLKRHLHATSPSRTAARIDRKSTRLNSSHYCAHTMPSSA